MSQWCKQSTGWSVRWSTGKLIAETERRAVSGSLSNTVRLVGGFIGRQRVGWLVR